MKTKFLSFAATVLVSATLYASEDDGSSVLTEDTLGMPIERGRRALGWHTPRFSEKLTKSLEGFMYIKPTPPHNIAGEAQINPIPYNTYPFSLPASEETGTLHLSNERPFVGADRSLLPVLHEAFRTGVNQIMITDSPDITPLRLLSTAFSRNDGKETYGLHFFGSARPDLIEKLGYVLKSWREGLAVCQHLDFAFSSGGEGINFTDPAQRGLFLKSLINLLNESNDIETVSLRFMHLTSEDLGFFADNLTSSLHPNLKRLIFSFNDITDNAMTEDGAIGKLLLAETNLPKLHVIDLKGNGLRDPSTWDLGYAANKRARQLKKESLHPSLPLSLGLSYHGFSEDTLARAGLQLINLRRFSDFQQPEGYTLEDSQALKAIYDGTIPHNNFLSRWVINSPRYDAIADLLLLLRSGRNPALSSVSLKDKKMTTKQVLSFLSHASARHPLESLDLRGAYGDVGEESHHRAIVDTMKTFSRTSQLSLSENQLGRVSFYGEAIEFLGRLRELNFSFTDFGSGAPAQLFESVQEHFGHYALRDHKSLQVLDYSRNIINDGDLLSIFATMGRNESLKWVSFRDNQVKLVDGVAKGRLGESILNFLESSTTLEYFNLAENPITADTLESFTTVYRAAIAKNPSRAWPVLVIDGLKEDGARTPLEYIASEQSVQKFTSVINRLGESYNQATDTFDPSMLRSATSPETGTSQGAGVGAGSSKK